MAPKRLSFLWRNLSRYSFSFSAAFLLIALCNLKTHPTSLQLFKCWILCSNTFNSFLSFKSRLQSRDSPNLAHFFQKNLNTFSILSNTCYLFIPIKGHVQSRDSPSRIPWIIFRMISPDTVLLFLDFLAKLTANLARVNKRGGCITGIWD